MQKAEAHVLFSETIGMGDWFYGTTLQDVRYAVEGWACYGGGSLPDNELPAKVILHFPNCRGGDVTEGYGIYNYLRGLAVKGVQVEARVEGLCASIAVLVALAADNVLMADAALWMVHKPSSDGWSMTADDMLAAAEVLNKIQAQIVGRYVARCGGKLDAATANELINKESWLNADECLAYGFVTGKLPDTAPLEVPTGADAVVNYFRPTNTLPPMAISAAEKKGIVDEVIAGIKNFFGPPKNEDPAPPPANAATSLAVTDGDPMYFDGAELAQGTAVYSDAELTTAYADGDYSLSDGRDATVASGTIETLTDAGADDSATNVAAELTAANAEIERLRTENALHARKVVGLQNKLKAVVPGTSGNPTPAGAAQNIGGKNTVGVAGPRDAERGLFVPRN